MEKKFPVMLKNAIVEGAETVFVAILSTVAALVIFSVAIGPVFGFAAIGWWPLSIVWGLLAAIVGVVVTQSGDQLIWCWKEDHKK